MPNGFGTQETRGGVFRRSFGTAGTTALFVALTAVMTWPQARVLTTHAADHFDVFFNLWRLRWVAHALAASPSQLFGGNIFYPERLVLTLSDAMLVEGFLGAPLFWLGLPPLLVHNILLLGAIVASGVGAFVLAKHLFGNWTGAVVAGIVYSFAPYRFEHYMHMELQWAVWIPWAFWALQRTIETGAVKYGVLTGAFASLQLFSSIYYAAFLAVLLPVVAVLQLIARNREALRVLTRLAVGGAIATCAFMVYESPYSRTSVRVGERDIQEITRYSAKPKDYLSATTTNFFYGERSRSLPERRLFPGFVAPALALFGLLLVSPRPATIAYLIGGILAFDISLGMYGVVHPFLFERIEVFQSLRAPSRASIFCLFFLGILAAQGCAAILAPQRTWLRRAVTPVLISLLLIEYWVAPLPLVRYPNEPPVLYSWLAEQPTGVVVEFPMPSTTAKPGRDPFYAYMSTFHWQPLVNGYSGYYPPSYISFLDRLEKFPDPTSIDLLWRSRVRYVIVHTGDYSSTDLSRILQALTDAGLELCGQFDDGLARAVVLRTY